MIALMIGAYTLCAPNHGGAAAVTIGGDCTPGGKKLYGLVKVVQPFADFKVKLVHHSLRALERTASAIGRQAARLAGAPRGAASQRLAAPSCYSRRGGLGRTIPHIPHRRLCTALCPGPALPDATCFR